MFFFLFSVVLQPDQTPKKPLQELLERDGYKKDKDSLKSYTQEKWIRPPGTERAHLQEKTIHSINRDFILAKLNALNMLDRVMPSKTQYTYIIFHGAYATTMENRISFFKNTLPNIQYKQVVFLTGARLLDPVKEPSFIALGFQTEYHVARYLMKKHKFHNVCVINAKGKNGARPNTADTVQAWLETSPQPGTILAISNNPYIQRQDLILKTLLGNKFQVETVGEAALSDIKISVLLDELARLIFTELQSKNF
ncbi:MAG: hypothetical protein H6850_00635 [Alphaproteobacteria bacterium]|nr:MAG: hypothetical protein H6850_00635 [Alphaproteobacteria bacterium]